MAVDARHQLLGRKLAEVCGLPATVVDAAIQKSVRELDEFFEPQGPSVIAWVQHGQGASVALRLLGSSEEAAPEGPLVWFARTVGRAVTEKNVEDELVAGVVAGNAVEAFRLLLAEVFLPLLVAQQGWGQASQQQTEDFLQGATKFSQLLTEAAQALTASKPLRLLPPPALEGVDLRPGSFNSAANVAGTAAACSECVGAWCIHAEAVLAEAGSPRKEEGEAGPNSELQWWQSRLSKLSSITMQLKTFEAKATLGIASAARSRTAKRWHELEVKTADAEAEAKDTLRYLQGLQASYEPLYKGSPQDIMAALPTILGHFHTMHSISRYYADKTKISAFLAKATNQIIANCKAHIISGGKLWDQEMPKLLSRLELACGVHTAYVQALRSAFAPELKAEAKVDETVAFIRMELFSKRCRKLVVLFTAVQQFSNLANHTHIAGLLPLLKSFEDMVKAIRTKPYDLLDFERNHFDRDFLEFNVHVNDLELALQKFVDAAFERNQSTDTALSLLLQFQTILQRDALLSNLESKYQVILNNYAKDLETVSQQYEAQKSSPPRPRDAPLVAGNIMWARHLLNRIEGPMKRFASIKTLASGKEYRRLVPVYNKVARTLADFQVLWHASWERSLEAAAHSLESNLVVAHPGTGNLLVNFDKSLQDVMWEARWLRHLGLNIPQSAQSILMQEEKFSIYYQQLSHALLEHERITAMIRPDMRPLLMGHLADLEGRLQPGMFVLTWSSLNIDGYLHHIHQGLAQLEDLVTSINDNLDNQVVANLGAIRTMTLLDLSAEQTYAAEEFTTVQSRVIQKQAEVLAVRNATLQRSVQEIISLVVEHRSEVAVDPQACMFFKQRFYDSAVEAMQETVSRNLRALRGRLEVSGGVGDWNAPLLEAAVLLDVPHVTISPSLGELQSVVSETADQVLICCKQLPTWVDVNAHGSGNFHVHLVNSDKVTSELGSLKTIMDSSKRGIDIYLTAFQPFAFLWQKDLATEYAAFLATKPGLEAFEDELRKYMTVEQAVAAIPPKHCMKSVALDAQPLKHSLRSEAALWKAQFARNLHKQGASDLKAFEVYVKDMSTKLSRRVEDLEDVRFVMSILKELRKKETDLDALMGPIEEMYALLRKYEVRVPGEELDAVGDLRYSWRRLHELASATSNTLSHLQVGFRNQLRKEISAFVVDAREFRGDWVANGPMAPNLSPADAVLRLNLFQQMFHVRKRKWDSYKSGEELFGLPLTQYEGLETTEQELGLLERLYGLYTDVISTITSYGGLLWTDVVAQIDAMNERVFSFQNSSKKLPKGLREWPAYLECKRTIDEFLEVLPLFQQLAHRAVRPRHWREVMRITGKDLNLAEDSFRLQHLLDMRLLSYAEEIEEICGAAVKEEAIESKLTGLTAQWSAAVFTFADYKTRGSVILQPGDTADLVEALEDSQMTLASLAANRYAVPFREEVTSWLSKLASVSEQVESWLQVQSLWMYMEAVFSGGDIVKQLPAEAKRFGNINKSFMKIITFATDTKNVVATCVTSDLLKTLLPHLMEQLELCQKSLSAYLEAKRAEFPRFYFVSDPTLLEILSLGSDPPSVVPHFQSGLFDSLTNVTFDKGSKSSMTEMWSQQGERVPLETPVEAKGMVETWVQGLVTGMQTTMKAVIKRAVRHVNELSLEEFLLNSPAQVALLGLQFQWTADTQAALVASKAEKGVLVKALKKAEAVLKEMVGMTLRSNLTRIQRISLETCITIHMHQKESTEELVRKKIKDPADFEWLKQCRFYWREDKQTVIISICDVDFEYSFEYLGVKERLVITPLTDVCYVTLSQALGMFLGGAPAGPAGTGKTETTKDLGNTLGKYVVVFNCSDQMDFKGMGKIYKGLAQSGLWGCFDEFNRINLDVLSVCAQQVHCILSAIRERRKSFVFTDGSTVSLDPHVGLFITMNPGYAGRVELPENLKALFRGVSMMVPNRQIIMKVKLAACGYQENEILAKKFYKLYGLCEQQLSKQPHYDFGLRNILSVLRTAGASKRAAPDQPESALMMRTLRDMNMSKFVADDVPLFLSLIQDLFPVQKTERSSFPDVSAALDKVIAERGLQAHPSWVNKCIQLYETYLVRHGIMLVGPSGSGKTTILECLAAALTELGTKHIIWRMNPKAITAPQMFGRMDAATGDWTDGVFSVLWRRAAKNKSQHTLIVLDGPVDAIWIENLNTVLDDNKVLTLANGDRILMTPQMKAMFETENLNNASPATVSRAGIIYVSNTELGWGPIVASWLQTRPPAEAAALSPLFHKFVDPMLDFVRLHTTPVLHNEAVGQVQTLLALLEAVIKATPTGSEARTPLAYERHFLYCLAWGIGGLLAPEDRKLFDTHLRTLTAEALPQCAEEDTLYEYLVLPSGTGWQHWREQVPPWLYPKEVENPKYAQLVIPTLDSVRYERLLGLLHSVNKPALLVGGPGTAKTNIVNQFLGGFSPEHMLSKTINFSSLTTPGIFQLTVEGSVEKRQGRTYGPPGGKQMTVFIDDLSMPFVNEWGDQITNEAVRQLLSQGGLYSLEKPIGDMRFVADTRYVACMNVPGGGKNDIPNRLKRQFAIFNVPEPSNAAITKIFGSLVKGRFDRDYFSEAVVKVAESLVPASVDLWKRIQSKMLPTPAKFHYLFNMRDLAKIFQGVLLASRDRFQLNSPLGQLPAFGGGVTGSEGYLLALWQHECHRVFVDKMVSLEDKAWVIAAIADVSKQHFAPEVAKQTQEAVFFADFLREPQVDPDTGEPLEVQPKFYEAVTRGLPEIRQKAEELQQKYVDSSKGVAAELVLFEDALVHLARICRILSLDGASALLVGVGGSGKQSLARLAADMSGAYPFQIQITKTYNVSNLLEDIKGLYKVAGLKGQKVAFIFTDTDVKEESFLEYINQLVMTGEVSGLFPKDEMDSLLNDIRPVFKRESPGVPDTADNLYRFLLGRVRAKLHVILCQSPVGAQFARRAQQFPGLINGCTIDWFLPWPQQALILVASKFVDSLSMACDDKVKESLKLLMGVTHSNVTKACQDYYARYRRHVYVTPKSYLSFLEVYKTLYSRKLAHTRAMATAINSGLQKMNDAKQDVNRMKGELAEKDKELVAASAEIEKLLQKIGENTAVAEKEKAKVAVIVNQVTHKAQEIARVKESAEKDLEAAKPALEAALAALNSITPKDIASLKVLKNPPDVVKRIFDCVLLLRYFPCNRVTWHDVKGSMVIEGTYEEAVKMMGDISFLSSLTNFPKEGINDETVELLQPYFAAPDFNYDAAKKASGNVAGLCNWAEAMCTYHTVEKDVAPKIAKLRAAEAELRVAEKEKGGALEQLASVQASLDEMQVQFEAAMQSKAALEADAASTQRRMDSANALLSALAGEEGRWTQQSQAFDTTIQRLTGDCAIASSFVSYLGPFNMEFRELLLTNDFQAAAAKLEIPVSPALNVTSFLADQPEIGQWNLQGLPTDELSIQNGILVTRATRYPLLVDPQGQGRAWLRTREAANQLKTIALTDKHFRNHLEECLALGKPLLIENVEEELDPVLDPVLDRRIIKKGKSMTIALADKEVTFTEGFRLYCTTRLPRPHFSPELSAKMTLVDFSVTHVGLEEQLLGKLILKEKTELEEQRQALAKEVQSYRAKIAQLEEDLLFRLSNSQDNLLDDTELIQVLANTKATAAEVTEKLAGANETERQIRMACEEFRPVAHRATLLYFLMADFSVVNCMYQTSLPQFTSLYEAAILRSERTPVAAKRVANIIEHLTHLMYLYVQRGLFERHKLVFALMLTTRILLAAGKVKQAEMDIFLKGGGALDITSVRKKPKDWIPDSVWLNVIALSSIDELRDLPDAVIRNEAAWRAWYDQEALERGQMPDYEGRLTKFERMCVVKAFREDRTLIAASDLIADALGQKYVDGVPLSIESVWEESAPSRPVICILSPGSDPSKLVEELAKRKKKRVLGVSLGQGQDVIARRLMATAAAEGHWVLLQNAHLGLAYLSEVEQQLLKSEALHEEYRVWITAEPHPSFPIGLLHMGLKLTNEAPVGMKAGLRASYQWVTQDMLDAVNRADWRQLLFVMCYMHSIVQERRKFGPVGWNIPYEFNQSDLGACVQFLQNHLIEVETKKSGQPTWETVRYMIGQIQYGGRITDDFDQLLMNTYASNFFQQAVLALGYQLHREERTKAAYAVPHASEIEEYRRAIEEMPGQESPGIFGMHPNADITFRSLQVQAAVQLILDTRPSGVAAIGGLSKEEIVDKICEDLLSKVPAPMNSEVVKERLSKLAGGSQMPLTVHLRQEIERLTAVIKLTASTLQDLRLAIAGAIALSASLSESLDALYNASIPKDWLRKSWETTTLGNWFLGLLQRHDQLNDWLLNGRPKAYWLTGFFNPQGFLTAVKQEVSRRHAGDKWALDDVVMAGEVLHPAREVEQIREAPQEGVYVYGLFLDGCAWSNKDGKLVDSEPKKLYHPLPVYYITGVQAKDRKKSGVYEAPLYKVKKRTGQNYIATFPLRTDEAPTKWTLRGAALVCSVD